MLWKIEDGGQGRISGPKSQHKGKFTRYLLALCLSHKMHKWSEEVRNLETSKDTNNSHPWQISFSPAKNKEVESLSPAQCEWGG